MSAFIPLPNLGFVERTLARQQVIVGVQFLILSDDLYTNATIKEIHSFLRTARA